MGHSVCNELPPCHRLTLPLVLHCTSPRVLPHRVTYSPSKSRTKVPGSSTSTTSQSSCGSLPPSLDPVDLHISLLRAIRPHPMPEVCGWTKRTSPVVCPMCSLAKCHRSLASTSSSRKSSNPRSHEETPKPDLISTNGRN